jgi:hypothetical protein
MKSVKPSGVKQPKAPGLPESSKIGGSQLNIASSAATQQKGMIMFIASQLSWVYVHLLE